MRMPNTLVILGIKAVSEVYARDKFRYLDMGAFSKYPDNNGIPYNQNLSFEKLVVVWLREGTKSLGNADAFAIVKNNYKSKNPVLRRLAVACINFHFNACQSLLWGMDENPFDDMEIFSDIFDMLKENKNDMSSDNLHMIALWAETSSFGTDTERFPQATAFRRALIFDVLRTISHSESRDEYQRKWEQQLEKISGNFKQEQAYNVSKHMYTSSAEWTEPDSIIADRFEKMTPQGIVDYINADQPEFQRDLWALGYGLERFFRTEYLLLLDNYEVFLDIPVNLLPFVIRSLSEVALWMWLLIDKN